MLTIIIVRSFGELFSGIVGKESPGEQFVSSDKIKILLRATSVGTIGYYFRTKVKKKRETFFLAQNFSPFSKFLK